MEHEDGGNAGDTTKNNDASINDATEDFKILVIPNDLKCKTNYLELPSYVSVETELFDPKTFKPKLDAEGNVAESELNCIRFREKIDEHTNEVIVESNANIVDWSDGSQSLFIGEKMFDLKTTKNPDFTITGQIEKDGRYTVLDKIENIMTIIPPNHGTAEFEGLVEKVQARQRESTKGVKYCEATKDPSIDLMKKTKEEAQKLRQVQKPLKECNPKKERAQLNSSKSVGVESENSVASRKQRE